MMHMKKRGGLLEFDSELGWDGRELEPCSVKGKNNKE